MDNDKALAEVLVRYPMMFCVPCFFGAPGSNDGRLNNATLTLLEYKGERYGITNYHVIDEYRRRLAEDPGVHLYFGGVKADLDLVLLDEDSDVDICVFYLEEYPEKDFATDGEVPTQFFPVGDLCYVENLVAGDFVLMGGYPGAWRVKLSSLNFQFDTLSFGGTEVSEATEMNIRCELKVGQSTLVSKNREKFPDNIGGLSGGPVFHHSVTNRGISKFEFVGVIYEYIHEYDSVLIRPASIFNRSMCIKAG